MSAAKLRHIATLKNIKYRGVMSREKLIEMLEANDKDPSIVNDPEFSKKYKELNATKWAKNA